MGASTLGTLEGGMGCLQLLGGGLGSQEPTVPGATERADYSPLHCRHRRRLLPGATCHLMTLPLPLSLPAPGNRLSSDQPPALPGSRLPAGEPTATTTITACTRELPVI